jgi:quercetin dioxygenase-like cupin family protein
MRRAFLVLCLLTAPALAGTPVTAPLVATDQTVIGQPLVSPSHPKVIATVISFQPGDKTAVHKHLFPHYGYMLEGSLTITNSETGQSFELKAGDFLVEMMDTWHYGENRGAVVTRMLVIDSVPEGMTANSVPKTDN